METKNQNTAHCQVQTVKYNGRDYRVQKDRNGFEYIKVSKNGKRVIIALSKLESKDPIINHVFNYGFRNNPNPELDKLARERMYN
ncbi:MAG: hypothetical protein ACRC0E_10615 [Soonwooa sp.]